MRKLKIRNQTTLCKNNNGITLGVLVITIIVLLILAEVSLNLIAGSNGIIGKAKIAVEENEKAKVLEEIELIIQESRMDYFINYNKNVTFFEYLKETFQTKGIDITENADGRLMVNYKGYNFYIDDDFRLI